MPLYKAVDEEAWVAVDLGTNHAFGRVNLYPRGSDGRFFPEEYDIRVSEDGEEWNTVKTVTGDTSTDISTKITAVTRAWAVTRTTAIPATIGVVCRPISPLITISKSMTNHKQTASPVTRAVSLPW